jgi:hypothetical protein
MAWEPGCGRTQTEGRKGERENMREGVGWEEREALRYLASQHQHQYQHERQQ